VNSHRCLELSCRKGVYNYFVYFCSHDINAISHLCDIALSRTLRSDRQTRLPALAGTLVICVQLRAGRTYGRLWSCCQVGGSSGCFFWVVCWCWLRSLAASISLCSSVITMTRLRHGRSRNRGLIPGRGEHFQLQSSRLALWFMKLWIQRH